MHMFGTESFALGVLCTRECAPYNMKAVIKLKLTKPVRSHWGTDRACVMQKACIVHDMNSVTDYRRLAHHHRGLYFTDDQKEEELQARFEEVAAPNSTRPMRVDVIMGRTLEVAQAGKLPFSSCSLCNYSMASRLA